MSVADKGVIFISTIFSLLILSVTSILLYKSTYFNIRNIKRIKKIDNKVYKETKCELIKINSAIQIETCKVNKKIKLKIYQS